MMLIKDIDFTAYFSKAACAKTGRIVWNSTFIPLINNIDKYEHYRKLLRYLGGQSGDQF